VQWCPSSAQSGSGMCTLHAGVKCSVQGCKTNADTAGKCRRHLYECSEQGCTQNEAMGAQGKCRHHAIDLLRDARATSSLRRPDPSSSDLTSSSFNARLRNKRGRLGDSGTHSSSLPSSRWCL
jgi:hypothetical protein